MEKPTIVFVYISIVVFLFGNGLTCTTSQRSATTSSVVVSDVHNYREVARQYLTLSEEPKEILFLNDNQGWSYSSHFLYVTRDGGNSWDKVSGNFAAGTGTIKSIRFLNERRGVVVVQEKERSSIQSTASFWQTTDGGKSWRRDQIRGVEIANVIGLDDRFYAFGSKQLGKGICFGPALYSSSSSSTEGWLDEFREFSIESNGECPNLMLMGLSGDKGGPLHVLRSDLNVYERSSGTSGWTKIRDYNREDDQSVIKGFGDASHGFWYLLSKDSEEGTEGTLVVDRPGTELRKTQRVASIFNAGIREGESFLIAGGKFGGKAGKKAEASVHGVLWKLNEDGSLIEILSEQDDTEFLSLAMSSTGSNIWLLGEHGLLIKLTEEHRQNKER